jgi:methionine biosynthesis protein MetW
MRRIDYKLIEDLVPEGATVLDLACGDGELLSELIAGKHVHGSGVEIDQAAVEKCIARGLSVFHGDLDAGLADFTDQSHDVVILSLSLQQLRRPRMIVREMVRVGRLAIVSFPNFAHWSTRLQLFARGRMPVTRDLPYQWWDTPNIHLCTIQDFRALCREEGLRIEHELYLSGTDRPAPEHPYLPNLLARIGIFAVARG